MKYRIKQYHGNFKQKYSENFYLFKKRFQKFWDRFMEKGHEKMTVMFIPHNEKKIFNFQISKFTILFFIILFVIILGTSSYALMKNNAVKKEEQRLLMSYEDIRSHLLRFEKHTNAIAELVEEIKPDVEQLYELSSGGMESQPLWTWDEGDKEELAELKKMKNVLPDEIFTLKGLEKDITCTTNTIKTVKNFIDVRSKVIQDTPSIVPSAGHITSLFGWRRSPFGHGRDFHSGIDIAASRGAPIHATAPGVVVSAGWSGGYGVTVRIRHKYGFESIYAHCNTVAVGAGAEVKKGDVVGFVGQTGNATGNHCHYEIRLGNFPINPYPYMSRIW